VCTQVRKPDDTSEAAEKHEAEHATNGQANDEHDPEARTADLDEIDRHIQSHFDNLNRQSWKARLRNLKKKDNEIVQKRREKVKKLGDGSMS